MLSNLHTHTVFCDGKNTPEEMVIKALEKGFSSLGFSGHGYTDFEDYYCMKDIDGYIKEISRLKEKYKNDIQIYLGAEEDMLRYVDRELFEYIIGSSHFLYIDGEYLGVDGTGSVEKCLKAVGGSPIAYAKAYYEPFCDYIHKRKPDIVGHFDLITKFDETGESVFFENGEYNKIAEEYMKIAAASGCFFEINTGAMARNLRKTPYPYNNLLQILIKNGNGLVLNSDCHRAENLDFAFSEIRPCLKDQGVKYLYTLYNGEFVKDYL